jgi:chromate reductase
MISFPARIRLTERCASPSIGRAKEIAMSRIAVIVGSLRRESIHRELAQAMTRLPAAQGHEFTWPEIGDIPLYNQDREGDPPPPMTRLKHEIRAVDGVMFVTPEYNRSVPGVLKNALDTASRPYGDSAWARKPAGIVSVSGGKPGAAMAQQHLRNVLAYLDMPTLNQPEAFVQWSDELVAADGEIGEGSREFLDGWMAAFVEWVAKFST